MTDHEIKIEELPAGADLDRLVVMALGKVLPESSFQDYGGSPRFMPSTLKSDALECLQCTEGYYRVQEDNGVVDVCVRDHCLRQEQPLPLVVSRCIVGWALEHGRLQPEVLRAVLAGSPPDAAAVSPDRSSTAPEECMETQTPKIPEIPIDAIDHQLDRLRRIAGCPEARLVISSIHEGRMSILFMGHRLGEPAGEGFVCLGAARSNDGWTETVRLAEEAARQVHNDQRQRSERKRFEERVERIVDRVLDEREADKEPGCGT